MQFNAIFAVAENGAFGLADGLPWPKHKGDMKHFMDSTLLDVLVMGYKTWLTIGELPGRKTIVISEQPIEGITTYPSVFDIPVDNQTYWIIGGLSLLNPSVFNLCERVYVTEMPGNLLATTYFDMSLLDNLEFMYSEPLGRSATLTCYRGGAGYDSMD